MLVGLHSFSLPQPHSACFFYFFIMLLPLLPPPCSQRKAWLYCSVSALWSAAATVLCFCAVIGSSHGCAVMCSWVMGIVSISRLFSCSTKTHKLVMVRNWPGVGLRLDTDVHTSLTRSQAAWVAPRGPQSSSHKHLLSPQMCHFTQTCCATLQLQRRLKMSHKVMMTVKTVQLEPQFASWVC